MRLSPHMLLLVQLILNQSPTSLHFVLFCVEVCHSLLLLVLRMDIHHLPSLSNPLGIEGLSKRSVERLGLVFLGWLVCAGSADDKYANAAANASTAEGA